jgi:hypothetical protein
LPLLIADKKKLMYTEFDLIAGRIRIKINLNDKKKIKIKIE